MAKKTMTAAEKKAEVMARLKKQTAKGVKKAKDNVDKKKSSSTSTSKRTVSRAEQLKKSKKKNPSY